MTEVQRQLFAIQDLGYKEFHAKLIPTVKPEVVIGVRTPQLRKFAAQFAKQPEAEQFLKELPHTYYEENNLHGFIVERIKDYEKAMEETERFLPYIDNWATCDMFAPKIFLKHREEVYQKALVWLESDKTYTIRYGIGILMSNYLDDWFCPEMAERVAGIQSKEYYVNMMIAWYMATALAKQEETILPYIKENRLDTWVHNKTIQKAIESRRISTELKEELRAMRRKKE